METSTQVLRHVMFGFADGDDREIWLGYGSGDLHYQLPPEATITIEKEVRGRSWALWWLLSNRECPMAVDLQVSTEAGGLERIESATFRRLARRKK